LAKHSVACLKVVFFQYTAALRTRNPSKIDAGTARSRIPCSSVRKLLLLHGYSHEFPPDWSGRIVLVMVLRRQWVLFVYSDLITAMDAPINGGIGRHPAWRSFGFEVVVFDLLKILWVIVQDHGVLRF
jgi:hypothetical protein